MNSTNISVRISENATVRLHWLCTELRSAWKQLLSTTSWGRSFVKRW